LAKANLRIGKSHFENGKSQIKNGKRQMNEPYRIKTAVAPEPLSRDEVKEYFENLERRRAVNPERNSARIMTR
jgi:hypothetical protein